MGRKNGSAAQKRAHARKPRAKTANATLEADSNGRLDEESTDGGANTEVSMEIERKDGAPTPLRFYPFAYALYNAYIDDHCWYCLAPSATLRRCLGCGRAMFCDQKCQQLGWKDHRAECKALKNTSEVPDIEVRLLGRIVTRFKAIKSGNDKKDPTFYLHRTSERSIMDIWAHTDIMKEDGFAMNKFNGIYSKLLAFYGAKAMISKEETFELHCRDYINRHAISDNAYLEEIGKGLYLDLCAYDHSCRPNAIYTCTGFVATLRALDSSVDLRNRSATFYSYIDLLSSLEERRKQLKDTWYFKCECARCADNGDNVLSSMLCPNCPEKAQHLCIFGEWQYKDPVTQILTCPKCHEEVPKEKVLAAIEAMRFVDRTVHKNETQQMPKELAVRFLTEMKQRFSQILPPVNVYMCKIIQLLIPLVDPEDHATLLSLHLESEECVRFCFPPNHPAVAVHLSNIGVFYLRGGHPHRAEFYLEMATEMLMFTLGEGHAMTMDKLQLLEDARRQVSDAKRFMLGALPTQPDTRMMEGETRRDESGRKDSANGSDLEGGEDDLPDLLGN